ncbi:carbohydrate-binding protein [Citrobacter sp. wls716]|uniref:carbohydrate-binding protein n=1 Tax=Citrobacter sp. wls716 TaxID=2576420 RepID=UPI00207B1176|nr:carbohydrate-binding protein [Citrobacter sp. wls716]
MSKIARYQGNVRAFASDAQGLERTVFGETNQADDLTSQITASFLRGWGIVGASEHPSLEDFNAAMYAMSQFIAYQHQMGIPEWHAEQEYHLGSICTHNGESYQSLQNANVGSQPPSAKWTPVLTSKNGLANLGLVITSGPTYLTAKIGAFIVMVGNCSKDTTPEGNLNVVFPFAFPDTVFYLNITQANASYAADTDPLIFSPYPSGPGPVTALGAAVRNSKTGASQPNKFVNARYIAVGKA